METFCNHLAFFWGMGPRHQLSVAQQKYDSTSTHKAL
ncbi:unnamed protein product [Wuchereria bancrofti]|uniref:Uncharacterized protein n=1 Tax=Wuchereria bancrofti TaxID=6293 RepID=A0A3P7G134_WUCBA|nr:unnamed protein product [Wuchereria bancrofti]